MKKEWSNVVISHIGGALYVPPNTGNRIHKDRQFHGFVLNAADGEKTYCFSDGKVMQTNSWYLFYLPKGSSYEVKVQKSGGCYAINFDADISDTPFAVKLRNVDTVRKRFNTACNEWKINTAAKYSSSMTAIYEAIYQIQKELKHQYMGSDKFDMIKNAVDEIDTNFTCSDINITDLSNMCGMSEVYFRRIFTQRFGVSPKEYIIQKRMEYAKRLLLSGEFGVSEIAELCGYAEPCHFSREFKKRTGVSPKEYI